MHNNVSQLLQQLNVALTESISVISGERLPFDEQSVPSDMSEESSGDDDTTRDPFSSGELAIRVSSIGDIQRNLYRLAYKIRDPRLRTNSTKAASIREIDDDTGVNLFDQFYKFDKKAFGRTSHGSSHAKKLSMQVDPVKKTSQKEKSPASDESQDINLAQLRQIEVAPKIEERSHISQTDATPDDLTLDDQTERETIASFASTALDIDGKGIGVPKPPIEALNGEPFFCPDCWVLPCTGNELYQTRKAWVDHEEAVHRPSWRCRDHPDVLYASSAGFRDHLLRDHDNSLSNEQLDDFLMVSKLGCVDDRDLCPICLESQPFPKGLTSHLANHLERIALFALPMTISRDDVDFDQSQLSKKFNLGSRGSSISQDLGKATTNQQTLSKRLTPHIQPAWANLYLPCPNSIEFDIDTSGNLPGYDKFAFELANTDAKRFIANGADALAKILKDTWKFLYKTMQEFDTVRQCSLDEQQERITPVVDALGGFGTVHDILEGIVQVLEGSISISTGLSKARECLGILFDLWSLERAPDEAQRSDFWNTYERVSSTTDEAEHSKIAKGQTPIIEPGFRVVPSHMFKPGEVFKIPSSEPSYESTTQSSCSGPVPGRGRILAPFRSFIVLNNNNGYSSCA
ncbi:Protein kinase domain containing protein [Fusarium austroafricanum]|uniref:Protein kinase domain containing protein n=1 Tax=Fusarium austroafricanum TaxID=2364996 RepID=A0A8H4KC70_9HYPO|nr:Protein kinase domain containing protein [Fusarium austroafricanum]